MWQFSLTSGWVNSQQMYLAAKPNELAAVIANLRRYKAILCVSKSPEAVEAAYVHKEISGIVSIDSSGFENVEKTRIYAFAENAKRLVYLLMIGREEARESDLQYCKNLVYYIVNEAQHEKTTE
jgi:hypothetical protein